MQNDFSYIKMFQQSQNPKLNEVQMLDVQQMQELKEKRGQENSKPKVEITKKIRKPKQKFNNEQFKILSFGMPQNNDMCQNINRKYKIKIVYLDLVKNTKHNKTVYFGKKNEEDYIDNNDLQLAQKMNMKIQGYTDIFNHKVLRVLLCNRVGLNIYQATAKLQEEINLINQQLQNKK